MHHGIVGVYSAVLDESKLHPLRCCDLCEGSPENAVSGDGIGVLDTFFGGHPQFWPIRKSSGNDDSCTSHINNNINCKTACNTACKLQQQRARCAMLPAEHPPDGYKPDALPTLLTQQQIRRTDMSPTGLFGRYDTTTPFRAPQTDVQTCELLYFLQDPWG